MYDAKKCDSEKHDYSHNRDMRHRLFYFKP